VSADLVVPLELLEQTAGSLDLLIEEFAGAGRIVDDFHDDIGSPKVLDALHDFSGNWKTHREELLHKMVAVRDMAAKGRQAFIDADNKLAADIRAAIETHEGGGP
jgi:hypothetical protein